MKIDCNECMDIYLSLDKNQKVPFTAIKHLLTCKKCRKNIKLLSHAQKLTASPLYIPTPVDSRTITDVMRKIDPSYNPPRRSLSLVQWIIAGIALIAGYIVMEVFFDIESTSTLLQIAVHFTIAFLIIAYCLVFALFNQELFIKKMNVRKS